MAKTIYRRDYRELVKQLRARREARGIAQTELAKQLGWPQQRVSQIENCLRRLDVIEFLELTAYLGLSSRAALKMAVDCLSRK